MDTDTENQPGSKPFAVVDMGSNGIRFAIVNSLSRHLDALWEERAPISLFDTRTHSGDIPEHIIDQVITTFKRFKILADEAGATTVRLIATEATRIAKNSEEFQRKIMEAVGWTVELLSKSQEAEVSAMGVIGSFHSLQGLAMDLGGGSIELNYVIRIPGEEFDDGRDFLSSPSAVSLPYGAAALKKRLAECNGDSKKRDELFTEIVAQLKQATQDVQIPARLQAQASIDGGYTLYLSGGGFRALGYMSMADTSLPQNHYQTYPIPIINGYSIPGADLLTVARKYRDASPHQLTSQLRIFRISKRRAAMIPACSFLVTALFECLHIHRVFFSEGGVRQGICYSMLSPTERNKDPLLEGVRAYACSQPRHPTPADVDILHHHLASAIPSNYLNPTANLPLYRLLPAALYLADISAQYPKESRANAAFHLPLAGGPLGHLRGITHGERAALGLILAYRWGGDIPDPTYQAIKRLTGGKHERKLCEFVGKVMEVIFAVAPLRPAEGLKESGIEFRVVETEEFEVNAKEKDEKKDKKDKKDKKPKRKKYGTEKPVVMITIPRSAGPMIDAVGVARMFEKLAGSEGDVGTEEGLVPGRGTDDEDDDVADDGDDEDGGKEKVKGADRKSGLVRMILRRV
ncbi:Ppx/GppA phosphatase family-domain-containing protein [Jimgerdemannia flammicorona]|uniref:Ppx/GppA phosphatase family-domain-containing protein n=1 Tax=Jimgerdemannia flammicorona TaxID=994334 RepID=A0A433DF42_9FUNG|nr:Ppx/GppA phosphatase family-domain-containing protein [Jimgerdemannia flammicorona]